MSDSGQSRSLDDIRAMSGLHPASGRPRVIAVGLRSAKTGCEQSQQSPRLFDHLVGECEQSVRYIQAERLRGFKVDDQLELGRLYDRQVGRLLAR
jgi:hypothetical protein